MCSHRMKSSISYESCGWGVFLVMVTLLGLRVVEGGLGGRSRLARNKARELRTGQEWQRDGDDDPDDAYTLGRGYPTPTASGILPPRSTETGFQRMPVRIGSLYAPPHPFLRRRPAGGDGSYGIVEHGFPDPPLREKPASRCSAP